MLAAIGKRAEGWIALTNGVVGKGRALFQAVVRGVELTRLDQNRRCDLGKSRG
jgi:hypothetical protein